MIPPGRVCTSCDTPLPDAAAFCPNCGEATPTQTAAGMVPPGAQDRASEERQYHQRLSRALGHDYRLGELIGRGGFGSVYAAWDKRLERDVAVKALRHDLFPSPSILRRFEREAKAVAKLRHPNILPIYTIGEGEGMAYMVMPLVEGESLRTRMERVGKLPVEEAVRITTEAARALDAAHGRGFVHRDVKPENIMLDGEERRVLLMDFGIAKAAASDETGLTGAGFILGSPWYMSPEQASGDTDVDHRADLYALGSVAYEMLSGRRPFKAKNLQELVYLHVTRAPVDLRTVEPEIPASVSGPIMTCLAKDRNDRFDSARSLVHALSEALPPARSWEQHAPTSRPTGVGTTLALGIFLLAFTAIGLSWLNDVAVTVADVSERGEGFRLAVMLLLPFQYLAMFLMALGTGVILWNVSLHYRRHRRLRTALAQTFPRPTKGVVVFAGTTAALLIWITLVFIMPTLQAMSASVEAPLPASARFAIWISTTVQAWWWVPFGGALVLYVVWQHRTGKSLVQVLKEPLRWPGASGRHGK